MESDSMDLKVRELLNSPALTKHVNDTVSAIKDAIDKIPDDLKVIADEASSFVRDIGADIVEFKFKKPASIEICGSYVIQCIVKPNINVDLFIWLPKIVDRNRGWFPKKGHYSSDLNLEPSHSAIAKKRKRILNLCRSQVQYLPKA
nr:hypothetical protein CFP56_29003 [Quercus suber]